MSHTARVLVVDDDEAILEFISQVLEDESYKVDTALNGTEALAVIEKAPPDLILLDMRMPVMDGWEFARAYRQRPGPHAPLIVITAARDAATLAAEIKADGYVPKPFTLNELINTVNTHARGPILAAHRHSD